MSVFDYVIHQLIYVINVLIYVMLCHLCARLREMYQDVCLGCAHV